MRKKVVIVTTRFPVPIVAGDALRIYHISKELAKSYEVDLIAYGDSAEIDLYTQELSHFNSVKLIPHRNAQAVFNMLIGLFLLRPLQVSYYRSRIFKELVRESSIEADFLIVHLARSVQFVEGLDSNVVVELTDYLPLTYRRTLESGAAGLKALAYRVEKLLLPRYQKRKLKQSYECVVVGQLDAELFEQDSPGISVSVVGNGIVPRGKVKFKGNRNDILFIGNMRTLQNQEAVEYFITHVLDRLLDECPGLCLRVVGEVPTQVSERFNSSNIIFEGFVEDLGAIAAECMLGICPVTIAAGQQNKILEYWSMGLPVCTSLEGAEGLNIVDGINALVCANPEQFVNNVLRIFKDKVLREQLSQNGFKEAENNYTWDGCLNSYPRF